MTKLSQNARKRRRQYAQLRGKWAEMLATFSLRLKGYHIVARGYRRPVGEVDIIARKGNILIAAEVKQRPSLEAALSAIHPKQRRRISRAMEAFIASHPDVENLDIRFDLLLVTSFFKIPVHIQNAW